MIPTRPDLRIEHCSATAKFIVEELYFPDEVMDGRKRLFCAAPIKLRGCGGAWTRAMLWEFD